MVSILSSYCLLEKVFFFLLLPFVSVSYLHSFIFPLSYAHLISFADLQNTLPRFKLWNNFCFMCLYADMQCGCCCQNNECHPYFACSEAGPDLERPNVRSLDCYLVQNIILDWCRGILMWKTELDF